MFDASLFLSPLLNWVPSPFRYAEKISPRCLRPEAPPLFFSSFFLFFSWRKMESPEAIRFCPFQELNQTRRLWHKE